MPRSEFFVGEKDTEEVLIKRLHLNFLILVIAINPNNHFSIFLNGRQ